MTISITRITNTVFVFLDLNYFILKITLMNLKKWYIFLPLKNNESQVDQLMLQLKRGHEDIAHDNERLASIKQMLDQLLDFLFSERIFLFLDQLFPYAELPPYPFL